MFCHYSISWRPHFDVRLHLLDAHFTIFWYFIYQTITPTNHLNTHDLLITKIGFWSYDSLLLSQVRIWTHLNNKYYKRTIYFLVFANSHTPQIKQTTILAKWWFYIFSINGLLQTICWNQKSIFISNFTTHINCYYFITWTLHIKSHF